MSTTSQRTGFSNDDLTGKIIGAAIEVHRCLGPGLLEPAYESCLEYELKQVQLRVRRQVPLPVIYKGLTLEQGFRIDLFVQDSVIVELKAVECLLPVHEAQLLSYLRFSGCKVGLLLNFNVLVLKHGGIKRVVLSEGVSKRA